MFSLRILAVVAVALLVVEASHFRYGTVSFTKNPTNPKVVTFKFDLAMRRSFFGSPNIGDTVNPGYLVWNSQSTSSAFKVTNLDAVNDIIYTTATQAYTFSGPGSYYVQFQSNARISNLNNNANGNFYFGATAILTATEIAGTTPINNSPVSGLLPVLSIPYNTVPFSYQIVASDPENDAITFRQSTVNEMQGTEPPGQTCSSSGLITLGSLALGYWSNQQVIQDSYGQNVAVDYLLSVNPTLSYCSGPCGNSGTCYSNGDCNSCGSCVPAAPAIVTSPLGSGAAFTSNLVAPASGSTVSVQTGQTITVNFVAYDSALPFGSTIVMYTSGVSTFVTVSSQSKCDAAHGCQFVGNYSNPQLLSITASPPASANGTVSTICVGVTSNGNALSYSQHCVNLAISAPVSVCGDGTISGSEQCDGGSCCDSTCKFKTSAAVCRASAGVCDVAETCTGSSASCPADSVASSTQTCRASAGNCDVAETCDGSSTSCPVDSFQSSTTTCRVSAGVCDVAETCTGSSASCPADSVASSTQTCRASAGDCDVAETCDGSSVSCPADSFQSSSQVCRASAGVCDATETCTGSSASCPSDAKAPTSTVCRASAGSCDVAETCDGANNACPTDSFRSPLTVCHTSGGVCDSNANCTGSSASCPNSFLPSTKVCRASAGVCDVVETCTGSAAACPADTLASSATVCRPVNGTCDVAEYCTGSSTSCPIDAVSQTTSCQQAAYVCPRLSTAGSQSWYCNPSNSSVYYQCYSTVSNGQQYNTYNTMKCATGSHCFCPYGTDCSCGGTRNPCTTTATAC